MDNFVAVTDVLATVFGGANPDGPPQLTIPGDCGTDWKINDANGLKPGVCRLKENPPRSR